MVPIFAGYALITWYFAALHRRRVLGVAAVVAGLIGLILLNWFHIKLGQWSKGEIYVPVMQSITYPYTVLVVAVGAFICCIPRHNGSVCSGCRYSLAGLDPSAGMLICPECGLKNATRDAYRRSGADRASFDRSDDPGNSAPRQPRPRRGGEDHHKPIVMRKVQRLPADDAPEPAEREDREREAPDQRPAEQAQHAR